jgi:hypothetical protein
MSTSSIQTKNLTNSVRCLPPCARKPSYKYPRIRPLLFFSFIRNPSRHPELRLDLVGKALGGFWIRGFGPPPLHKFSSDILLCAPHLSDRLNATQEHCLRHTSTPESASGPQLQPPFPDATGTKSWRWWHPRDWRHPPHPVRYSPDSKDHRNLAAIRVWAGAPQELSLAVTSRWATQVLTVRSRSDGVYSFF